MTHRSLLIVSIASYISIHMTSIPFQNGKIKLIKNKIISRNRASLCVKITQFPSKCYLKLATFAHAFNTENTLEQLSQSLAEHPYR